MFRNGEHQRGFRQPIHLTGDKTMGSKVDDAIIGKVRGFYRLLGRLRAKFYVAVGDAERRCYGFELHGRAGKRRQQPGTQGVKVGSAAAEIGGKTAYGRRACGRRLRATRAPGLFPVEKGIAESRQWLAPGYMGCDLTQDFET